MKDRKTCHPPTEERECDWKAQIQDAYGPRIPWGRTGQPADVPCVAALLASDESEHMTGSTVFTDGGLTGA